MCPYCGSDFGAHRFCACLYGVDRNDALLRHSPGSQSSLAPGVASADHYYFTWCLTLAFCIERPFPRRSAYHPLFDAALALRDPDRLPDRRRAGTMANIL